MADRSLTTVPKPQVPAQQVQAEQFIKRTRDALVSVTPKDMYSVGGGKTAPNAHMVDAMAALEEIPIKVEILKVWKTKEDCGIIMRGWKGDKDNPIIEMSDSVVHNFPALFIESVFDALANGIKIPTGRILERYGRKYPETEDYSLTNLDWELGADGWPVVTNMTVQLQLLRNHLKKMSFAERDCVTKCRRRILLKLMGKYDTTKEEGQNEEVEAVREEKTDEIEPKTLNDYKSKIYDTILMLAQNDKVEAGHILMEISKVEGFMPVQQVASIDNLDHAAEILARVRQKIIEQENYDTSRINKCDNFSG